MYQYVLIDNFVKIYFEGLQNLEEYATNVYEYL